MKTLNEKEKVNLTNQFFSTYEKNPPIDLDDLYDWCDNHFNTFDDENEWYGIHTELSIITSVFLSLLRRGLTDKRIIEMYKRGGYDCYQTVMIPLYQTTLPTYTEVEVS